VLPIVANKLACDIDRKTGPSRYGSILVFPLRRLADPDPPDPYHMFLDLLDPHPYPLVRDMDPDPSIIKQK
jgi:hypothetical protein